MQSFACDRCGWSTDETSEGWDRLRKLGTCPRCEARRNRFAFFRSPKRMAKAVGKLAAVLGVSAVLGIGCGLFLPAKYRAFEAPIISIGTLIPAVLLYRKTPGRPLK